jgi:hypothetical protein
MTEQNLNTEPSNSTKPVLCDVTLKYLILGFEERLFMLKKRRQTSITLGRISEIDRIIAKLYLFKSNNIA